MAEAKVGERVRVRYADGEFRYILIVEVTAVRAPDEFHGLVKTIHSCWGERGEVTGGRVFDRLSGKKRKFSSEDIAS